MAETLLDKCLARNIRMTSQRQIIIKVIEGSDDHPDVDQLYLRSVAEDNTISIATVYRTVKLLPYLCNCPVAHPSTQIPPLSV